MKIRNFAMASVLGMSALNVAAFENTDFINAAEATVNSVVSIKSYTKPKVVNNRFNPFESDPFFEFFFGPQPRRQNPQPDAEKEPELKQSGLGSGVILDSIGVIITNNHVIDGADRLEVTLNDNRSFDATVLGTDPMSDLAVIKIDATGLHPIVMGESDDLRVGEWVLAVGNPFGFTSTVTTGIVSAKARNISSVTGGRSKVVESYIQTDAAVNPGNSGGALVNLKGELVGINTAIYSQTGNYSGNSFAIPTSIVRKVVDDITNYGSVQRAVLGVSFTELTPKLAKEKGVTATAEGLYVHEVVKNSTAMEGGIMEGDVIVGINNHPTATTGQLQEAMAKLRPGDVAIVEVIRDNQPLSFDVTLKNNKGDTSITKDNDFNELGCSFAPVSEEKCKELKIKSGLQVTSLTDGKFKKAGIRDGFIIVDINNTYVTKADEVKQLYNMIVESDEYDHVMFISGVYPGSPKKYYYAVDLTD